jgi:hypothetical protein
MTPQTSILHWCTIYIQSPQIHSNEHWKNVVIISCTTQFFCSIELVSSVRSTFTFEAKWFGEDPTSNDSASNLEEGVKIPIDRCIRLGWYQIMAGVLIEKPLSSSFIWLGGWYFGWVPNCITLLTRWATSQKGQCRTLQFIDHSFNQNDAYDSNNLHKIYNSKSCYEYEKLIFCGSLLMLPVFLPQLISWASKMVRVASCQSIHPSIHQPMVHVL